MAAAAGRDVWSIRDRCRNGCSPKFCVFALLLGSRQGVVHAELGKPKTYYASLVQDAVTSFCRTSDI